MNRLLAALGVLAAVIVTVTTGFWFNTDTADTVNSLLLESMSHARRGEREEAAVFLERARNEWEDHMQMMLLFVSHGKLDQIEQTINAACSYLDSDEMALCLAECSTARLLIRNFANVEYPTLNNIF